MKEAVPNCGLGDFDCKLPMKPGKYEVDDGGFTLPNPIEIPEMLVLVLADWFGNPIKISAKFFGKDGKEIICLDFELQLNLEWSAIVSYASYYSRFLRTFWSNIMGTWYLTF